MDFTTIGTVIGITVICYLVGRGCKAAKKFEDEWIPVTMGIVGCGLGIAGLFIIPDFPANDVITAAAVGIASGLAATGADQAYKQMTSK